MIRFDSYAEALRLRERAFAAAIEITFGLKSPHAGIAALAWWYDMIFEGSDNRYRIDLLIDDCRRLEGRFMKRFQEALACYPR